MYQLLLAVCINGEAALCMDRRLPLGEDMNMMRCMREGLVHAQKWADARPDLELKSWRCITEQQEPKPLEDFAVEEVGNGVFVHRGQHAIPAPVNLNDTSNIGFVIGQDAVAVIDAGGSAAVARAVMFHIRERTDLPVKYLILTHMHPDHVLGAQVFKDAGATVIGHRKLERALKARSQTYTDNLRRLMGDAGFEGSAVILPDEGVEGTRDIDIGGRVLTLVSHPTAHTDNDLTVRDSETGIFFLGDLLFAGHTPALDGSITGWTRLMDELSGEDVKGVVPGHGPALMDWPEGLTPMLGYLKSITKDVRAAIADGTTMNDAVREIGEEHREDWELFDEFHPRNVTTAYKELEWE